MAATLIDALVVSLGLDPSNFTKGQKGVAAALLNTRKDAEATAKDMEARGKQAAQFFTKIRNEALSFFAVLTVGSGIKDFVANQITGAASLGRMSANLQMSTRDLSAWQKAAERAGGTSEGITNQLKESQSETAKYASGITPSSIQAFAKYGGNFDAFKDGNSYLLERSRIIAELYAKSPARAALAANELGISEDNYNLIKQGPAAIQALIDAQKKRSVVTEEDSRQAIELENHYSDLKDTFQATGQRILFALVPSLEKLITLFQQLGDWVLEHKDDIRDFIAGSVTLVTDLVEGVRTAVGLFRDLGKAVLDALGLDFKTGGLEDLKNAFKEINDAMQVVIRVLNGDWAGAWEAAQTVGKDITTGRPNGAMFSSKGGGDASKPAGGKGSASQNEVMDKLMGLGWTREQAAGIAANLKQESNFNPNAVGDGGKAFGVAQWHPDRQADFKAKFGKDIRTADLDEQLAFLDHELREGKEKAAGDKLRGATNAANAGAIVSKYYERPADTIGEMSNRARSAEQIAQQEATRAAAWAAANPERAQSAAGAGRGTMGTSTSTSEVNIQKIEVVTQATDANGIARDMASAVRKNGLVTQANTGLQ